MRWASGDARNGHDFLQRNGDHGRADVSADHFFKALKSPRRLPNLRSVNALLAGRTLILEDS